MRLPKIRMVAGVVLLLVVGWFGRVAWRAHHDLVTLDVQDEPVSQVVQSMREQTWETIYSDTRLNEVKISLRIKDQPLSKALDLITQKAHARWQRVFAVGESDQTALAQLKSSIEEHSQLKNSIWTNLAPRYSIADLRRTFGSHTPNFSEMTQGHPGNMKPGASAGFGMSGGGNNQSFTISSDGAINHWSSARLIMQKPLLSKLRPETTLEVTEQNAKRVAGLVGSRSHLYFAIEANPAQGGGVGGTTREDFVRWRDFADNSSVASAVSQRSRQQRVKDLSDSPEDQVVRAQQGGAGREGIEGGQ